MKLIYNPGWMWVLTASFLLQVDFLFGQEKVQPTFPSPNAAALGKYGDIPVNNHTGVPSISVPVYTVEEGSLKLPITLNYHASGHRVSEIASWVGLGWSLSAGGMISRSVIGGPDEGITKGTIIGGTSPYVNRGWYKNYGILPELITCGDRPLSTEGPQIGTLPSWGGCRALYVEAGKGFIDTEPDLFTFNFSGYSGKFFFDANRKIHMIPEADVFIEPINSPGLFYAWKIIAPDGNKYFFGGAGATEDSFSDPDELSGNKHVSSSTSWYLYKVESANGEDWINLEYVDDTYSFGNRSGHSISFNEFGVTPGVVSGDIYHVSQIPGTSIVDGKQLSRITTGSGYTTIDFLQSAAPREDLSKYVKSGGTPIYNIELANTSSKSLAAIQIAYGSLCKKFDFSYDYYSSANCSGCVGPSWYGSTFDQKRLRLNWVQESSCSGTQLPKYEFTYNATQLPRRYSLARDKWEFYNGYDTNEGLLESFTNPVPGITITYTTANQRSVNEALTKAGILTRIKYPTGGTSDFDYECHRVSDVSPVVGGLRIKSIVNSDGQGNTLTKTFKYGTGKLYLDPANYEYQYPNNNDNFTFASLGGSDFGISHSSNPLPPMWSSHGYHFGYEQASVEQTGNGKTDLSYMNIAPAFINPGQFPLKPLVAAIGTGETLNEVVKKNDGTAINSSASSRGLTGSTITTVNARKVNLVGCMNCGGGGSEFGIWTDYGITTYRYNLLNKTDIKDGVTVTTSYGYDATGKHNNPTSMQFTDSQGRIQRSETIYPSDAGSGAPLAMFDASAGDFKNMISLPIEQKKLMNGTLTQRSVNQFTNIAGSVLLTKSTAYPTGTSDYEETGYEYNGTNNLAVIKKNDGVNVSYLWGYNNKYPIAQIKNATVPMAAPASTISGNTITANVSSCTNLSPGTITLQFPQTVSLAVSLQGAAGLSTTLSLKAGSTIYFTKSYTPGSYNESLFLPAGTYQYCYTSSGFPGGYCAINVTTNYQTNISRPLAFHTSFEETGSSDAASKTGKKVFNGAFNLIMPGQMGTYVVTYWQRPAAGGTWTYNELSVTTTSTTPPDQVVGQTGYSLDEVRMYPKGVEMTTYTYEPGLGVLSMTDANNVCSYYEYDVLGRLQLMKDDKRNILKTYQYNYKINPSAQ